MDVAPIGVSSKAYLETSARYGLISRLFRGYHLAYLLLGFVVFSEFILAVMIGGRLYDTTPTDLLVVGNLLAVLPGWFLLPLAWIGLVTFHLVRRKSNRPTFALLRLIRAKSDWLLRGVILLAVFPITSRCFGVLKSAIPEINPYSLDPFLVKLDRWVLGDDAWRISHQIMPDWFLISIDRVYILWFTYVIIVTGIFSFTRNRKVQIQGALTFYLSWLLLGIAAAIALSSVGPVFFDRFYGQAEFSDLISTLENADARHGLIAFNAINYLINNYGTGKFGTGISAMPSMHVSMAFLGFLLAMQFERMVWLKIFTAAFTCATIMGSVHLGWHYLSDSLVAIVGVWLIWWTVGIFLDWSFRPPIGVIQPGAMAKGYIHPLRQDQVG